MHDTRPALTPNAAQIGDVVKEGVDQRPLFMTRCWMDDHPRGFVDDDDVAVFVNDIERQSLGRRGRCKRLGQIDSDDITVANSGVGLGALHAGQGHVAVLDQPLDL